MENTNKQTNICAQRRLRSASLADLRLCCTHEEAKSIWLFRECVMDTLDGYFGSESSPDCSVWGCPDPLPPISRSAYESSAIYLFSSNSTIRRV